MARRVDGWRDMSSKDRYDEAARNVIRLQQRREYLKRRGASQQIIARYDFEINCAIDERNLWDMVANDHAEDKMRREYEQNDIGQTFNSLQR